MSTFGDRVRARREELSLTQAELAKKMGYKSRSSINKIELNQRNMKQSQIAALATALDTTPAYLMGWNEEETQQHETFTIPVLGRVAAGIPIEAVEDIVDYEELSSDIFKDSPKSYFGLKIKGHSMEPRICDGDYVIVHKQDDAECDDIVIAKVNGEEATCKRLKKYSEGLALVSLNPSYEPMVFTPDQVRDLPVRVIGKVVELRGKL